MRARARVLTVVAVVGCAFATAAQAPTVAAPLATISGQLVDWNGVPVAGATVNDPAQSSKVLAVTAADGTFAFQQAPADYQRINVSLTAGRANDRSISSAFLGPFKVDTTDLDLGAVRIGRPDQPRRLVVTDAQGDPIQGAGWTFATSCVNARRPDLPQSPSGGVAELSSCTTLNYNGYNPTLPALRSDVRGQLFFTLPTGYADQVIAATGLSVVDPTGAVYSPRLADAVYDPASATYTLAVAGVDVPALRSPTAPRNVTVKATRARDLAVRWSSPISPGSAPVTGYTATVTAPGLPTLTKDVAASGEPSATFAVPLGHTYTATVVAHSEVGTSPGAADRIRLVAVPSRPGKPVVRQVGARAVRVRWSPPNSLGGTTKVTYRLHVDGQKVATTRDRKATIRQLERGRHWTYVVALNEKGTSYRSRTTVFRIQPRHG